METRVALIGIIVEQESSAAALNALLHEYGGYIIGRMGLPYRERGVNIISVVLDAPQDKIAALSGKIGGCPVSAPKHSIPTSFHGKEKTNEKICIPAAGGADGRRSAVRLRQAAPRPPRLPRRRPSPSG